MSHENTTLIFGQQGQALAEGLVVLCAILLLFQAGSWLARLQDIALTGHHASRYGAFELARAGAVSQEKLRQRFFSEGRWKNTAGQAMVPVGAVTSSVNRSAKLDQHGQPGADQPSASTLRNEWDLQDKGIARLDLEIRPARALRYEGAAARSELSGADLGFAERIAIVLRRYCAILTDAGHTADVQSAHERASASDAAWRRVARASRSAAEKVMSVAGPVDTPWNRARPSTDWFMPWVGRRP